MGLLASYCRDTMSKLGLLQQYGKCKCENPTLVQHAHQEMIRDKNGQPVGTNGVIDYKCTDCGGVRFNR